MDTIPNDPAAEILPAPTLETVADASVAGLDLVKLAAGLSSLQTNLKTLKTMKDRAESVALALKKDLDGTNKTLADVTAERDRLSAALAAAPTTSAAPLAVHGEDSLHVPTVDPTHLPQQVDAEIDWSLKHGSDLLITGPTGSGKTAPVVQACARHKRPMRRVCFDGETTSGDLIGRRDAANGATVWTDGVLPQAMEAGQVLLVDEIDRADESARAALFSVLDSRSLYLPVPNKRIQAASGFQLIGCCNGVGDNSGAYTGTQPIDAAFLGRWLDVVRVEYPTQMAELAIIKAHVPGVHDAFANKLCEFFAVLRKAEIDGNLTGPFSIRQSKHFAKLQFMFRAQGNEPKASAARACIRTLVDRTEPDNRATIRETFQRIFGFECKV